MESLSDSYSFLTYSCAILNIAIWNECYFEKSGNKANTSSGEDHEMALPLVKKY